MNAQHIESNSASFPGINYEIGVGNVLGDDELFKEIMVMFYEDHANDCNSIQKAIVDSDQNSCKRLVHTLKGVACSVGAMDLFEHVKLLDAAINENKDGEYQTLFNVIKPEFYKVMQGIEVVLADKI